MNALSRHHYTDAELDRARQAMNTLMAELGSALQHHAPDGRWQPTSADQVAQLSEADAVLNRLYRALGSTRRELRAVDSTARDRLLDHPEKGRLPAA